MVLLGAAEGAREEKREEELPAVSILELARKICLLFLSFLDPEMLDFGQSPASRTPRQRKAPRPLLPS